ncbi:MAG: endonuclease VII domain-containing protein [bacterium]
MDSLRRKKQKALSNRKWFLHNRERALATQRAWLHADRNRIKIKNLKYKYGITFDQYNTLVKKQNKKCAICFDDNSLCVDHNHKTGKVRGLLCKSCNSRLGWFEGRKLQILKYLTN